MSTYNPDRWVLVEVSDRNETYKKVFAGWYGGYGGGDSWKISSGVVSATIDADGYYTFTNISGSIYRCHAHCYGMSGLMHNVWASFEEDAAKDTDKAYKMQVFELAEIKPI